MIRTEIRLDTLTSVNKFVATMGQIDEQVWLEDGNGCRVSAKSVLGALYSLEWGHIYCLCNRNISAYLMPWMI